VTEDIDDWDAHWAGLSASAANNPAQHFRHRLLSRLVKDASPSKVVDIGCGQGDLLARLATDVPTAALAGLELSQVGVDDSLRKVPGADVRRVDLLDDASVGQLSEIAADVATCCEVLEHLDEPRQFLDAAKHALAPDATLFVTVPGGPRSSFDRTIGHRRHYSPAAIRELLESTGYVVSDAYGAGFPFFNLYRLVVVARGRKLIEDVGAAETSRLATAAMKGFDVLLKLTIPWPRWGWQTVAIATVARTDHASRP
jgi:SAM-dependent methyltransferase